jgi:thymidylate synthase
MHSYLTLIRDVMAFGTRRPNRTGVDTLAIPGAMIRHPMSKGFPLLTTKRVPSRWVFAELEMFIKGITDKQWLLDRGVTIWKDWARQDKIPYGHGEDTRARMREERDLGPIYGWQWRHFGAEYPDTGPDKWKPIGTPIVGHQGCDQLANVVHKLKTDPSDRRMIVSAWNPVDIPKMGLPPCHFCFQVLVIQETLHLLWNIRSVDLAIGLPFNIASYATLLHLLALESGFKEGTCVGFLGDAHIYVNHLPGLQEQVGRQPYPLPQIITENFTSIFDWEHTDTRVEDYTHHPKIPFEIAV